MDIAERYIDAINAADIDALLALFTPDAVLVNPYGTFAGHDQMRGFYEGTVLAGKARMRIRSVTTDGQKVRAELLATSPLGSGDEMLAIDDFVLADDGRITRLDIEYPERG